MCCLFGWIDYGNRLSSKQKNKLTRALAVASEERGTDAAGIAYLSGGALRIHKRPGPARKLHINLPQNVSVLMGHTRMATQGSARYRPNNHPFPGQAGRTHFALAHNGVLYNDKELRHRRNLPQTRIQTDSYVAVQLLEQQGALTPDSLKKMAEAVEGSFVFTVLDEQNRLYVVKGDNPLTIYHYPHLGLYVYASTQPILQQALQGTWLDREPFREVAITEGDILRFDRQGPVTVGQFTMRYPFYDLGWRPYFGRRSRSIPADDSYLHTLKQVASNLGYRPEDIDALLADGYSTDDIEEALYGFPDWPAYR